MDIPCAPILVDITVNGRTVKAVAQPTKQAFLYVFDRVTGEPIWPIEERPVPKGDVPGEWYSPTQPFPTKPPAYDRQGVVDRRSDRLHAGAARGGGASWSRGTGSGRSSRRRSVSKVEGPARDADDGAQGAARTGRAARTIPRRTSLYVASQSVVAPLGLVPPPPGAIGHAVSSRAPLLTRRAADPARRGCRRSAGRAAARNGAGEAALALTRAGAAAGQAAVRPHQRDRPEQRRDPLADRARRDAGQHPQSSGAQGPDDSAHRPGRQRSARW